MPPRKKTAATTQPPAKRQKKEARDDDDDDPILDSKDHAAIAPPPPIPSEPTTPIQHSYTYASRVPPECSKIDTANPSVKVPCALGVDEAGRGPVLGPLVYGIAYCPVAYQDSLKQIGFADSKALTSERRDQLLSALIDHDAHLGWAVRVMSPQDISAGMLRRRPVNLNAQSSQATVSLIAGVLEQGVDVTEIYVDTVGDPKSYARLLSSHFPRHPHIKWTVTSKADAIYPIVGAASIAAKVTRDRCIEHWKYAEQPAPAQHTVLGDTTNRPAPPVGEPQKRRIEADVWDSMGALGSGYPGDPNTVAYLKRTLDPVFGWPGIVRFSWATAKTMLEEKIKPPTSKPPTTDTPEPVLGGKRLTRSLSRTSSIADTTPALQPDAEGNVAATHAVSLYGTPLPQPGVQGATVPRAYRVKWIDEPVAISKFFGAKKPAPKPGSSADAATATLQCEINDWLKTESTWRAKSDTAPTQLQINTNKMLKDLGIATADATFSLF
ncbi:ribonuclease HII [Moesziomyces antarcticus]|uniref:Related to 35 kDa ribonuclease H n=2 Tax=Pseudozyma antarctica TaxID=84753 RepID=A0A5C3FWF4_PSEA2|nr:ribonuclease HII [Moesziomyces antarcticus]GAK67482.1 ribonuclease HII [Moesziomyces antarcticus]SPO48743.1 related to 35 kDa ribonuclease H [Moesziomyces antarcticus]